MKAPRSKRLALLIMAGVLLVSMAHPALALLDQDGDGLFDGWEWQFGFSLSGSYPGGAGGADLDGDGMTNLKESLAGTNPRDPGSRLALRAEANIAAHELRLHFPTMTGRLYQVEKCTNLSQPTWEPVGDEVNGNDADAVVVTTLPQQEGAAVFFRLKARPDPGGLRRRRPAGLVGERTRP